MRRLLQFALASFLFTTAVFAADDDSKPTLLSTTGGGKGWSSPQALEKDAELGKPAALAAFGEMLLTGGDQVPKDVPRALGMLERAATAGEISAAFRLGKVYDDGDFASRDPAKAAAYYKQAARAGVSEAQYNLGALYMNGRGIKRDYKEGLAWLIIAAKNGADPSTEQQIRQRFQATHREKIIAAAEARANELSGEIAKSHPAATPTAGSK